MEGPKRCPEWLKEAYRKAVKGTCEECGRKESEVGNLEPHRIIRGNMGGTYRPGNIKMVCQECHKKYHYGEFK